MNEYNSPFVPLQWQIPAWRDKSPVLLLTGSAGGGKSQLAAEKVHAFMQKYAGATGVGLRKAREYASKSIVPMMQYAIGNDSSITYVDNCFRYPNGSRFYIGGMKDKSQREAVRSLRGKHGEPDILWMEEANAFTRDDYDEASARVRGKVTDWNQVILTTNPDSPHHWIYKDLILGGEANTYYSSAKDNPNLPLAYFNRLDKLVGVLRDRLRDGKWVQAEGVIYDEFDTEIHLIDLDKCPEFVRRFRVVDFGYSNPFVCQWWGMDADGRLSRYREIYITRKLVEDLTPKIIELSKDESFEANVADHDAEDRATMAKHGINTTAAKKDVITGIQAVKARLKVQPDGKPRLYLVRNALIEPDALLEEEKRPLCLEDEITGYIWKKYEDGRPNKEEPVKVNDHACDAMRYLVKHVDETMNPDSLVDFA